MLTNKFKRGLTLIELMVTLGILGILVVIAQVSYSGYHKRSKQYKGRNHLSSMMVAAQTFRANAGFFLPNLRQMHIPLKGVLEYTYGIQCHNEDSGRCGNGSSLSPSGGDPPFRCGSNTNTCWAGYVIFHNYREDLKNADGCDSINYNQFCNELTGDKKRRFFGYTQEYPPFPKAISFSNIADVAASLDGDVYEPFFTLVDSVHGDPSAKDEDDSKKKIRPMCGTDATDHKTAEQKILLGKNPCALNIRMAPNKARFDSILSDSRVTSAIDKDVPGSPGEPLYNSKSSWNYLSIIGASCLDGWNNPSGSDVNDCDGEVHVMMVDSKSPREYREISF